MNAERLHKILDDLFQDIQEKDLSSKMRSVVDNLQNQVNQPSQPTYQTELVRSLNELYSALENSEYNNYSPGWKEIIHEIRGGDLLGSSLMDFIQRIFLENAITPAAALEKIQVIVKDFELFKKGLESTLDGFGTLGIGQEELEPGQCELGYSIPRNYVDNELSLFRKEVSELTFILNTISEAVTGEQQTVKINTISSSDFLLYVFIGLEVANVLSNALEKIIENYKTILEIKELRNKLKAAGVPDKETKGIEKHANEKMETEIKKISKEIVTKNYQGDGGRRNEIESGLTISLNKLANRIDKGFNVEIRIEPLAEKNDGEENTTDEKLKEKLIASIQRSSSKIEYINADAKSILELPEGEEPAPNKK